MIDIHTHFFYEGGHTENFQNEADLARGAPVKLTVSPAEFDAAMQPVDRAIVLACRALRVRNARAFFGCRPARFRRWPVSRTVSNAYYLRRHGKPNVQRAPLQQVERGESQILGGQADTRFARPSSSVSLVEVEAVPAKAHKQDVQNRKHK